jgi:hypothetical protein
MTPPRFHVPGRPALRARRAVPWALAALLAAPGGGALAGWPALVPAEAHRTQLIGLQQGTAASARVRDISRQGFELAGGGWVDFGRWYRPAWTDTEVSFLTPLRPHLGLIWGVSTGERGEKYRIDPSLRLGLLLIGEQGPRTRWSVQVTTVLGGRLRERACTADYGDIGGVQAVNCRLAASELPPAQTLDYLLNEKPGGRTRIALRWSHAF